jgi:(1->4)-alpha-D-glucan 1-alpha-D-glucosylmutase
MRDIGEFASRLVLPGRINSLSQTILKLTSPGIPDTYQGTELWDLSLVDPDNRRPVDYSHRRELVAELPSLDVEQVCARMDEGLPKLWLMHKALRFRAEHPQPFGAQSSYTSINAQGAKAEHVVAYMRGDTVMAVVPRLLVSLADDWVDTVIDVPEGSWFNVLTDEELVGGSVRVSDLFRKFPVALLARR